MTLNSADDKLSGPGNTRPVLIWNPDQDVTHVKPTIEEAAEFLKVPAESVAAAIRSGDLLGGWFVDWDASAGAG